MNASALGTLARRHKAAIILTLLTVVAAVVFRAPLVAWFTGEPVRVGGSSAVVKADAGGLAVEAAIEPDAPRQKGNTLHLVLRDKQGAPIQGADVKVEYVMPPMGGMSEMRGAAEVASKGAGTYDARFDLPMAGSWTLEVAVDSKAATGTIRFSLTVGTSGLRVVGASGATEARELAPPSLPRRELPAPALAALENAFTAYEEVRAALAQDRLEPVGPPARLAAQQMNAAARSLAAESSDVADCVRAGAAAAETLAAARSLDEARTAFGEVSRLLVALAAADERLQAGWHLFRCPMAVGFKSWFQKSASLENPYMGQAMSSCGSPVDWRAAVAAATSGPMSHEGHGHQGDEIAYYTCAMHPSVDKKEPGACPICSMTLSPVTYDETESGVVRVNQERRQQIGLKTATVTRAPMSISIRAVGRLTYDETRLKDVTLKVKGWIAKLRVNATGQPVKKGEVLLTLYSPDLYAAQQEYLLALDSQRGAAAGRSDYLVKAAEKKLALWDLSPAQIAAIAKRGQPVEELPILAPASGFVIEKDVIEGAAVEPGQRLYRIAALDKVWIEAQVYEMDLAQVRKGQVAKVSLPYQTGEPIVGTVAYVYPYLDPASRTGRVRIELPNKDLAFKPDMYANVELAVDLGPRIQIPIDAVVYTGPRRLVFVDVGEDRLRPQEVTLGARNADAVEVTSGLTEGQVIVTSANFLVAAESRIRSAAKLWADDAAGGSQKAGGAHAGHQ